VVADFEFNHMKSITSRTLILITLCFSSSLWAEPSVIVQAASSVYSLGCNASDLVNGTQYVTFDSSAPPTDIPKVPQTVKTSVGCDPSFSGTSNTVVDQFSPNFTSGHGEIAASGIEGASFVAVSQSLVTYSINVTDKEGTPIQFDIDWHSDTEGFSPAFYIKVIGPPDATSYDLFDTTNPSPLNGKISQQKRLSEGQWLFEIHAITTAVSPDSVGGPDLPPLPAYSQATQYNFRITAGPILIDPVPDLLRSGSSAVSTTSTATATPPPVTITDGSDDLSKGRVVQGLATDGVAQVIIRVPASTVGEQITLSLPDNQCGSPDVAACMADYGRLFDPNSPPKDVFSNQLDTGKCTGTVCVVTAKPTAQGPMAFAAYRAPVDFVRNDNEVNTDNDKKEPMRSIDINVKSLATNIPLTLTVQLVRQLVVLVHGLWDDPDHAWKDFGALTNNPLFSIKLANYSQAVAIDSALPNVYSSDKLKTEVKANSLGFRFNATNLFKDLSDWLADFKRGKNTVGLSVAAIQADFVGHSMGGVVIRTMTTLNDFATDTTYSKGPIHKLITIGTPHLGSPLGQILLDPATQQQNECSQKVLTWSDSLYSFKLAQLSEKKEIITGAVADLAGDIHGNPLSDALKMLKSSYYQIPTVMLAGLMSENQLAALDEGPLIICIAPFFCKPALLRAFCPNSPVAQNLTTSNWTSVVGNESDAIVPLESQANGLLSDVTVFINTVHSDGAVALGFGGPGELADETGIPQAVVEQLNSSVVSPSADNRYVCLPSVTEKRCLAGK